MQRGAARKRLDADPPLLVAIVGGSGAGKSLLAKKLKAAFPGRAACFSLDSFYHDLSRLASAQRREVNFDHPNAIDWLEFERVLRNCRDGRAAVPRYDFRIHCRGPGLHRLIPKPFILVDGLWLLRRPAIRRLFDFRIFVDCPERTRLARRLARDLVSRGRTEPHVRRQFRETVQPMHRKYVQPQKRWADVVLRGCWGSREVRQLAGKLADLRGRARTGCNQVSH